jgi:hypothetical protein
MLGFEVTGAAGADVADPVGSTLAKDSAID